MTEQAEQILARLETMAPGAPELSVLRAGVDSAKQLPYSPASEPPISFEESEIVEAAPAIVEDPAAPAPAAHVSSQPQPWPSERPIVHKPTPEMEPALAESLDPLPIPEHPAAAIPPQANTRFAPGTLDEFVADLEASLGNDFMVEAAPKAVPPPAPEMAAAPAIPVPKITGPIESHAARAAVASASRAVEQTPAPLAPTPPVHVPPPVSRVQTPAPLPPQRFDPASSVDLSSMFGELKQELEHDAASADEDPETHYNLGVAFREMGLLDEAIGELQKVCQYVDRGHTFPNLMQAYTWLSQCFLEKGMPEVAVRWYEKALKLPNLDQETRTALHYELASALEAAGNNPAALSNFLEVYSSNIDYRDVAERIKALRP
jgi:TolA-binding protein